MRTGEDYSEVIFLRGFKRNLHLGLSAAVRNQFIPFLLPLSTDCVFCRINERHQINGTGPIGSIRFILCKGLVWINQQQGGCEGGEADSVHDFPPKVCGVDYTLWLACDKKVDEAKARGKGEEVGDQRSEVGGWRSEARGQPDTRTVAQVSNLLCRGFPIRRPPPIERATSCERSAGWKPAIQQVGNLRYGVCAQLRPVGGLARRGVRSPYDVCKMLCFWALQIGKTWQV
ncbi:MAG: hypothetical protein HZC54_03480 [Verrucomicrobia bacterium]|nr:hypothetical protein [Verrucomicrobiota bacterium]